MTAVWLGCTSSGQAEATSSGIDSRLRRHRPRPTPTPQPTPALDPDELALLQADDPAIGSLEDYLLPADNPWVKRARIRGIEWPLVRNEGVCRLYQPQEGKASYYHEAQALASGGRFDPDGLSAAHRTLPFGTVVRATRTDTNESVTVVINDRGPYIDGRIIDLSEGAAKKIHQIDDGVVPIRLDILAYPLIDTMGPNGNG